uniref:Uncharacterized protein n=1 Tax=Cacopsylla melanoneura TaxID=428564 RepID=A0A8D8X047_9HEMI
MHFYLVLLPSNSLVLCPSLQHLSLYYPSISVLAFPLICALSVLLVSFFLAFSRLPFSQHVPHTSIFFLSKLALYWELHTLFLSLYSSSFAIDGLLGLGSDHIFFGGPFSQR